MGSDTGVTIHTSEIPMEVKASIFDLACEKYIEGRELKAGDWSKGRGWNSPQEYMGYAVYKQLVDSGALVFEPMGVQRKIKTG